MKKAYYETVKSKLTSKFTGQIQFKENQPNNSVILSSVILKDVLNFLKNDMEFEVLIDLFVVDYPEKEKRFEVTYNLLSVKSNSRISLKVYVKDGDSIPSVVDIFKTAGWLEREAWDMYGVHFEGNPDMRRLLTDYGFEGHPMRKDFPLSGYKEVKYDAEKAKVVYQPVNLTQEFRDFEFESPWEGTEYKDLKKEKTK
ncbi:MAG: NADH-quinone oxidoreductase subunit C [Alphaproteobacteria bacterium]|nr:NADH-quinone oxidoreductase subunit C [Alphaproteobacteria bacterium]